MKFIVAANLSWNLYNFRLPLITALKQAGHEVVLLAAMDDYTARLRALGFRCLDLPLSQRGMNPLQEARSILHIRDVYRTEKPDTVQHFTPKVVIYGSLAAKAERVPRIVNTITGLGYAFSAPRRGTWWLRALSGALYRLALHKTVLLFQNADDMRRMGDLLGNRPPEMRLLAVASVDLKRFAPAPEPPGPARVLLAARLMREKGVEYFIEAARLIRDEGVEARFVLSGSPPDDPQRSVTTRTLRGWVEEGIVEWWGWRDDMEGVFARAHIVCLPTYYGEGVPRTLVEAAACGRAIVATDIPGCRRVVRHGGNGLLVPVRDAAALAAAILRLIREPELRRSMGARGREIAQAEFGSGADLAQYFAAYGLPPPPPAG